MNENDRADQPDPGPRLRHPRRWRAWWRRGGARRTARGHGPVVGADWFDPRMTDFLGDTAWLVGQPVPLASLGDAVIDLSSCMLPAWPWASTGRRKASRPLHPTAPLRADRRRLQRTSGAGRGRAHAGRPGRPSARHTHTLSGASDTMGSDSGDGDGPAGSDGAGQSRRWRRPAPGTAWPWQPPSGQGIQRAWWCPRCKAEVVA
jgi:hypothetical protein